MVLFTACSRQRAFFGFDFLKLPVGLMERTQKLSLQDFIPHRKRNFKPGPEFPYVKDFWFRKFNFLTLSSSSS